ncbi:MAG: RNA polymerase sigma factor RpoD/SigA [bacterium]|nr:RNA polymerase sigma factor RpoD/SigA [bacterium]MDZ4284623.1 RNA polymerase sigma factor RpoD/SigA [Patescibacteria group bacterium]
MRGEYKEDRQYVVVHGGENEDLSDEGSSEFNLATNIDALKGEGTANNIARYLSDVRRYTLLTRKQEQQLFKRLELLRARVLRILHLAPTTWAVIERLRKEIARGEVAISEITAREGDESAERLWAAFSTSADELDELFVRLDALRQGGVREHVQRKARRVRLERREVLRSIVEKLAQELCLTEVVYTMLRSALERGVEECPENRSVYVSYMALVRAEERLKAVADLVIASNTRLVVHVAKHYRRSGMPFLDLIQQGNLGLMRACRTFEYQRGLRFSTYATWWVRQSIMRSFVGRRIVRLPEYIEDKVGRFFGVCDASIATHGRQPSASELAEALGIPVERAHTLLDTFGVSGCVYQISLDKPIPRDKGGRARSPLDFLADSRVASAEAREIVRSTDALLRSLLECLDAREQDIVQLRYGLREHKPHTLRQVAVVRRLSQERIRQIEVGALQKLQDRASRCGPLARELVRELFHLRAQEE